jgi:hypothetical protein
VKDEFLEPFLSVQKKKQEIDKHKNKSNKNAERLSITKRKKKVPGQSLS